MGPILTCRDPAVSAIFAHTADRVRELLAEGANPNTTDQAAMSPSSFWSRMLALLRFRHEPPQKAGIPALELASQGSNPEMVRTLVEAGASLLVNSNSARDGETNPLLAAVSNPLLVAAEFPDISLTQLLLQKGCDVRGAAGADALSVAARNCNVPVLKLLLEHGADPNATPSIGEFPLAAVVESPEPSAAAVKLLLQYHADPNCPLRDISFGRGGPLKLAALLAEGPSKSLGAPGYPRSPHVYGEILRILKAHGARLHAGRPSPY